MEKNFGHSENSGLFDRFMRDYLTIKLGRIPTVKEIYSEFKQYSLNKDIKEIVKDIFEFSKYFANIALEKEPDKEIREIFLDINELKVDVSYPFILQIYSDYIKEKITKEDLIQILKLIESYVFRRAICGVPTNSLNKTFSTLYKSIDKENYLESVQAIIILQDSYRRCPNDDEFKRELIIKDVYNFRNRNYLLRRLENFERKEYVDVESYTIEHIMPQNQNLSDEWKKELGENWKEIQKTYLHTIGNLTLTGYNSELSDRPFKVKRDMEGGFKDSPIRLNNFLANKENWNEEKIKERAEEVTKLAIKTWSYPKLNSETLSKYAPKEEETEKQKYTIDDHKYLKEGELMRPLFEELRKKILNIDSSVKEDSKFLYIAYKSVTNFVDIIPQQKALRLSLNISFDKIKDPKGLCKDVAGKGKWGNGDTEIKISTNKEIDYALNLIKQAFDNIAGIE
jgi:predicted transport protein